MKKDHEQEIEVANARLTRHSVASPGWSDEQKTPLPQGMRQEYKKGTEGGAKAAASINALEKVTPDGAGSPAPAPKAGV